ncbi:MAG TPA: hypothetical protein VLM38_13320 [Blastocatellia bacterium]|nr:hypothetical protein [Blastocatellia bacterium]
MSAYHSLSTYSDRGTSIVRLPGGGVYAIELETLFKRPGKLRFAWTTQSNLAPGHKQDGLIWCDGTTAWASYSFRGNTPEQKKNLDLAVAGATGASWGTAHWIARLLTDEVGGIRLDELRDIKVFGNDTVEGVECVVLVGYHAAGGEHKLWVGNKDHLIRRIEERSKTGSQEEVRTQILVDRDIPDSRFSKEGR